MTAPHGASFLDFFVLEASDYVEQIDGLLAKAEAAGPDATAMQRVARALRGSATMAKLPTFAELASSIESIARSLKQGALGWEPGLKGAITAAVDDLKILVRSARAWSDAEDQWAMKRIAELSRFAQSPASSLTPIATTSPEFFATETNNIAAGLELLATRPDDRENAMNVLRRVRALRGVAGMRDVPALAEVSEAAEAALRPIEMGEPNLSPARVNLLRVAGDLLRAVSAGLTSGKTVTTATPEYTSFLSALDAMMSDVAGSDRVIPIADLFYHDAGPHVVHTSQNPPTTPAQRFRMEVVSLGEHLHRVIDEARAAADEIQREHARGQLGRALRAIRATAASFGQMSVAQTVEAYLERTGQLNVSALDAIASFATTISPAAVAQTPTAQQAFRQSGAGSAVPAQSPRVTQPRAAVTPAIVEEQTPIAPPPTVAPPPPHAPRAGQPSTHARVFEAQHAPPAPAAPAPRAITAPRGHQALDSTIAAFESLSNERMAEPRPITDGDGELTPVDALMYRGRAALDRAIELRDQIRRAGGHPAPEVLEELYDLVELARVE